MHLIRITVIVDTHSLFKLVEFSERLCRILVHFILGFHPEYELLRVVSR